MFECAAGCGSRGESAVELTSKAKVPPMGWITIGLDIAGQEPPFQTREERYSGVVCSIDCAIAYLSRKKRVMSMSVLADSLSSLIYIEDETRSDVAKKIGFTVLEAIEEIPDDSTTVLLPLDAEENSLSQSVCLALFPYIPEVTDV